MDHEMTAVPNRKNNYRGLLPTLSAEHEHLGGNIKYGDPFTHCPSALKYLVSRFAIRSALDIGSGTGYAADFLHKQGVGVLAVDGLRENVLKAVYPTLLHDLTLSPIQCSVDFVFCQEVVEHIREEHLGNVLSSLCCGKIIVMTHGLPGQRGHHHVNLQPPKYWIDHLEDRGCGLLAEDTDRIRQLAALDGASFMRDTALVFANYARY
ncbi:class I SAM-dependent methyltransferase [Agrobacterium rhizogenes]|uniref:Methyltransferase domain protein n=2 Tax=Rhizobium rhizogenes TaxID=359 RepID=A0A7S5DRT5_RHIRH|nr:class I SAM-dependent methyltransferase [Rhizobium rhizogenes]NTF78969.1 class I SAM-dependent methyltransferase [Rhizobium rhizogenes]NTJ51498.1 class I SAM-dependent methyltransferase [Rhizobium rhizogenes]QCL10256.1 methyltransferase domain protein [Rhizobium rhizogenes]